jgi:hypothetical protein
MEYCNNLHKLTFLLEVTTINNLLNDIFFPCNLTNLSLLFLECWIFKLMHYSPTCTLGCVNLAFQWPACFCKPSNLGTNLSQCSTTYNFCTLPYSTYHFPQLQIMSMSTSLPRHFGTFNSTPILFFNVRPLWRGVSKR